MQHLCEGGNLHEYVVNGKRSTEELLALICQVGEALQFAHDRGYVHRDVKPANILLHENRAYLADFDLVKGSDTTGGTRTNAGMGSFLYASPELLSSAQDAGKEADVYGLGMTTLFALYGEVLPGITVRDSSPLIQALTCGNTIKRAISQAVAWQVEERTSSVAEFCKALLADESQNEQVLTEPGSKESVSKRLGESWIYVAPGSFIMGDDTSSDTDEKPQHPVRISEGFWMGRFTVSNAEYRRCLDAGGYGTKAYWYEKAPALPNLKLHLRPGLVNHLDCEMERVKTWPKYARLDSLRQRFPSARSRSQPVVLRQIYRLERELEVWLQSRSCEEYQQQMKIQVAQCCCEASMDPITYGNKVTPVPILDVVFSRVFLEGGFHLIIGNPQKNEVPHCL